MESYVMNGSKKGKYSIYLQFSTQSSLYLHLHPQGIYELQGGEIQENDVS